MLWILTRAMLQRNPYLANGEEMVLETCLIYFIWVDLGAAYSLDRLIASYVVSPNPHASRLANQNDAMEYCPHLCH